MYSAQITATDAAGWPWDPGHMSTEPDVYFSVSINDALMFTSAPSVLDSLTPRWDLAVPIDVAPGDTLVVGIWDDDGMGDDELGSFSFSVADMIEAGPDATLSSEFVTELKLGFSQ